MKFAIPKAEVKKKSLACQKNIKLNGDYGLQIENSIRNHQSEIQN